MKSSKKRRTRRTSTQRSSAQRSSAQRTEVPQAFTDAEEAFFAAGVEASESGRFDGLTEVTDATGASRPGLLRRLTNLVTRQRAA